MDDMFTLYDSSECTKENVVELAQRIGSANRGDVSMGALMFLMEWKDSHELALSAIEVLCSLIFENCIGSLIKIWPCIAKAMPGTQVDSKKFEKALLAKAEKVK